MIFINNDYLNHDVRIENVCHKSEFLITHNCAYRDIVCANYQYYNLTRYNNYSNSKINRAVEMVIYLNSEMSKLN